MGTVARLSEETVAESAEQVPGGSESGGVRTASRFRLSGDNAVYAACFGLAFVFLGMTIYDVRTRQVAEQKAIEAQVVSDVTAAELLTGRSAFLGDGNAPYTLVEFGDYECPPCRASQAKLKEILTRYAGKVKLDFRHFPLTQIHPQALGAAEVAELARVSGAFWSVHERLFSSELSQSGLLKPVPFSERERLRKQILADGALAKGLGVSGTPSFFVCRPDGRVLRLPDLETLERVLPQ